MLSTDTGSDKGTAEVARDSSPEVCSLPGGQGGWGEGERGGVTLHASAFLWEVRYVVYP